LLFLAALLVVPFLMTLCIRIKESKPAAGDAEVLAS
jgi:hypothetical protein